MRNVQYALACQTTYQRKRTARNATEQVSGMEKFAIRATELAQMFVELKEGTLTLWKGE